MNVDFSLLLNVIKLIEKPSIRIFNKARIWFFNKTRKSTIKREEAKRIASTFLGGDIIKAVPYRNFKNKHNFIAILWGQSLEESFNRKIFILEQFGNSFRTIWESRNLWGVSNIKVIDIDKDGSKEILFIETSFGTGGGTKILFIYSTNKDQLYQISKSYDWQEASGPISPNIEITPEAEADETFIQDVENYAESIGFTDSELADYSNPKYSVQKWFRDNGKKVSGQVKIHFYDGKPVYGASISKTLETKNILWIAYFKGPLVGYIKSKNKHFIAFAPSWIYNWITWLFYVDDILFFGLHSELGIMSFEFYENKGYLNQYKMIKNRKVPLINEMKYEGGNLIINKTLKIPIQQFKKEFRYNDERTP